MVRLLRAAATPVAISIILLVLAQLVIAAPVAAGEGGVDYRPPVEGPVVDPFREPTSPYGPGNRGIDYAVPTGSVVRAAADGEVVFAGPVAGTLHVTLLHADGLRTSYSFLASVAVRAGQRIRQGEAVGTSFERVHFGVRDPDDRYLDPALLLAHRLRVRVRLVPGVEEGAAPLVAQERRALAEVVRDSLPSFGQAVDALRLRYRLARHYAFELRPETRITRVVTQLAAWWPTRDDCTSTDAAVEPLAERHVAVLVGGLGSTSGSAAIDDLDLGALGYAEGDVIRFSYRGGRTPDPSDAVWTGDLAVNDYTAADSQSEFEAEGARLADLLVAVSQAQPGVPVDLIAHSQGGVVARFALADLAGRSALPPEVQNLVTLGTPHAGADLATAAVAADAGPFSSPVIDRAVEGAAGLDIHSPAVGELSEVSTATSQLLRTPVPPSVRLTSIAARGDLVVPTSRSSVPGEAFVVVPLTGVDAHDRLPGSAGAAREVALAVHGRPTSCTTLGRRAVDLAEGEAVSLFTDAVGARLLIEGTAPAVGF